MKELPGAAWLAIPDFRQNLFDELSISPDKPGPGVSVWGDLVYRDLSASAQAPSAFWHRARLEKPFIAEFSTISEAAAILRGIQRNWAHFPVSSFRRAELVKAKLPFVNEKPKTFPYAVPLAPMGVWSLVDEHTLFASATTSSPFPAGHILFEEDHVNPPSRAYLKMYEALAWVAYLDSTGWRTGATASIPNGRYTDGIASIPNGRYTTPQTGKADLSALPGPGARCVDAGACPGGWTWALDRLGATVTAIDRSELDARLMAKPNISFISHDAFTLKPEDLGPQDWVCSDVICYPPRLLEWIRKWIDSGLCRNFICTIKMQGGADHETTRAFASIPGSRVVHLTANKNELTWLCRLP